MLVIRVFEDKSETVSESFHACMLLVRSVESATSYKVLQIKYVDYLFCTTQTQTKYKASTRTAEPNCPTTLYDKHTRVSSKRRGIKYVQRNQNAVPIIALLEV
jgi:hypothetical protein